MTCEIIEPRGVTLNGGNGAYGGSLTSFTINLGPIGSAQKASATLVGSQLRTPQAGEDFIAEVQGASFKLQVAGYTMSATAGGATSMTLDLRDTSNRFLDKSFIMLGEESGAVEGQGARNVLVLGRKFGPIPDAELGLNGIYTANKDTLWGDLRNFYSSNTPKNFQESDGEYADRVDGLIRAAAGKVLYETQDLVDVLPLGPGSLLLNGFWDFKGSFRDVIGGFLSATGSVGWWDMDKEEVVIVSSKNTENGLAKLNTIRSSCEVISSGESVDYSTTTSSGAQGSITTSWPGEGSSWGGLKMSRFLGAQALRPQFKYKTCRNKSAAGGMKKLNFADPNVLKAMRAAANPKVFAAYAAQSAIGSDAREDVIAEFQAVAPQIKDTKKVELPGQKVPQVIKGTLDLNWDFLLPEGGALFGADANGNPASGNAFLADYFKYKKGSQCSAGYTTVKLGRQDNDFANIEFAGNAVVMAQTGQTNKKGAIDPGEGDKKKPKGWNNDPQNPPMDPMGLFEGSEESAKFADGQIVAGMNSYFDSIISKKGVLGDSDVLRMYLLALYKFVNRFWVIKANGIDPSVGYRASNFEISGTDYGYYLTSSASSANMNLTAPEGYEIKSVNPLTPLGECGISELKSLALVLSAMYLPVGTALSSVMGAAPDADNPDPEMAKGAGGAAVIDFIWALESDTQTTLKSKGRMPTERPKRSGLEPFFNGVSIGGKKIQPPRRAVDEEERPELLMYLITNKSPADDLADVPEFSFAANNQQREAGGNAGEIQGAETTNGPALKYAEEGIIDLSSTIGKVWPATMLTNTDEGNPVLLGMQTQTAGGGALNLHGAVPKGYLSVGGNDPFGPQDAVPATDDSPARAAQPGKQFIPPAGMQAPGPSKIKVWYDAQGAVNSLNEEAGDVTLAAFKTPAEGKDIWTSKMALGLSISAADIGTSNGLNQDWEAFPEKPADKYSQRNRGLMRQQLLLHLDNAATVDMTHGVSQTLTWVSTPDSEGFQIPTMEEGLESFGISVNGMQTQISMTVGGKVFSQGVKSLSNNSLNVPAGQYRPTAIMPNDFTEGLNATMRRTLGNS